MSTDAVRARSRPAPTLLAAGLSAVLTLALTLAVGAEATAQEEGAAAQLAEDEELVERGAELFGTHCALCHGELGRGLRVEGPRGGPSLQGVGAASVDFMLRTGRMPMSNAQDRLERGPQRFSDTDRQALIAYIEQLAPGEGPDLPEVEGWQGADPAQGLELYTTNCVACHGPTAQGVAVGQRDVSSDLVVAEPIEIATAIRSGPGVMPAFGADVLTEHELRQITAWVMHLREREEHGGWSFGRSGTVTEGFVAVSLGLGLLTVAMYLLGERARDEPEAGSDEEAHRERS